MNFFRRHWRKLVFIPLLAPVVLVLLLVVLLYLPPVQQWASQYAARKASEATGMTIEVGKLRLGFPLSLYLADVRAIKSVGDTLASVSELRVDVSLMPLFENRVEVSGLGVAQAHINYVDSTGSNHLKARIGSLQTTAMELDIKGEKASLGRWLLQDTDIYYVSTDTTTKPEQKKDPLRWLIHLRGADLKNIKADIRMPLDSLFVLAEIKVGSLSGVKADLFHSKFNAERIHIEHSSATYARDTLGSIDPNVLDPAHIYVQEVNLEARDLMSQKDALSLSLLGGSLRERSGVHLIGLKAKYDMDSTYIRVRGLDARINRSVLRGDIYLQMGLLDKDPNAEARTELYASFYPEDIKRLSDFDLASIHGTPSVRQIIAKVDSPMELDVDIRGSATLMDIKQLSLSWLPYIQFKGSGRVAHLMDDKRRVGELTINGQTAGRIGDLVTFFAPDVAKKYTIPSGLNLRGKVGINRDTYKADITMSDAGRQLTLDGLVDIKTERYRINAAIDGIDVRRYMTADSIGPIYASISAIGRGFDFLDDRTYSDIDINVTQAQYGSCQIDSLALIANLKDGNLAASLGSRAEAVRFQAYIDAILSREAVSAAIVIDADTMDVQRLGFSKSPFAASFHLNGSAQSNLKDAHVLDFNLTDLRVTAGDERIAPREIQLSAQTGADSVVMRIESGDLKLSLLVSEYLDSLSSKMSAFTAMLSQELDRVSGMEQSRTDLKEVYAHLPNAHFRLLMGKENPLADYLKYRNMHLAYGDIDIRTSPRIGLDGLIDLQDLRSDTTRIDRVTLAIGEGVNTSYFPRTEVSPIDSNATPMTASDLSAEYLNLMLRLQKTPFRNQKAFNIEIAGRASLRDVSLRGMYLNDKREKAVQLGFQVCRDGTGYGLHFEPAPYPFVLGQHEISVNPDNEIYYYKETQRIRANLSLTGPDSAQLKIYTPKREDDLEEIVLLVKRLELGNFHAIPAMANFAGMLFADLRVQRSGGAKGQYMAAGDISVGDLTYATNRVGNLSASFFYEPRNNVSHYINGDISYNGSSALMLEGVYNTDSRLKPIDASVTLTDFPLAIANPIVGADVATLFGQALGSLTIVGTTSSPNVDGSIRLHRAGAKVTQLGTTIYTDSIPLRFERSAIFFDRYKLYTDAAHNNPLAVDGSFILFGQRSMYTDLSISASELALVNSREAADGQLLYGRLVVGTNLTVRGSVSAVRVRGNVDILGNTNCTYIYADSPLKPQNRMAGVVEFTDFSDTLFLAQRKEIHTVNFGGMDVMVGIHIAPAAQLGVDLSPGHSDYVQIRGGGDLTFSYPPFGEMSLTGRYEMNGGGDVRYNLPVVGSKMFKIEPSSYISWSGDVANPYISFKATQRVRADVSEGGSKSNRKVNFDVGIVARENLNGLDLAFDLSAPEDLSLESQIKAMSPEERGKQAIGLMATGMYLASGGGKFNFDDALSALIQSELNNVTGKLLEGSDLSIGMQDSGDPSAGANPDITYSFSRRFFNDRVRVVIGGKVQTGNAPTASRERTFIDNVSLEYRIDQAGSHYLKLFRQNKTDNILEGTVTETGVGYLIRRKLNRVNELFDFRRKRNNLASPSQLPLNNRLQPSQQTPSDTIRKVSNDSTTIR